MKSKMIFNARAKMAILALPLAIALSACSSTGQKAGEVSEGERKFTEKLLFPTQKLPEAKPFDKRDIGCPPISLLEGTAAWRIGGDGARGVSHQASIHDLARECVQQGSTMQIKVGVAGRVVLGEGGRAGSYSVPVRIVVREGDKILQSRVLSASVSVPDGGSVPFTLVDESISVPITAADPADQYTVVVGLDPRSGGGAKASRKKRRR